MRRNVYTAPPVAAFDRAGTRRKQADLLPSVVADPRLRVTVVWRGRHLLRPSARASGPAGALWLEGLDAQAALALAEVTAWLGESGAGLHVAALWPTSLEVAEHPTSRALLPADPSTGFRDLRGLATGLPATDAHLLGFARGLGEWHARHRHCGSCGAPTAIAEAGHVRRCTGCGAQHFPRTDPAVIMLVLEASSLGAGAQARCLLARGHRLPPGMWSTLAGFVEPGESLEDAVVREVWEEVGVPVEAVHYHSSQPWPFPSSLMVGFHAVAGDPRITVDTEEIEAARWLTRAEVEADDTSRGFRLPGADSIARCLIDDWLAGVVAL